MYEWRSLTRAERMKVLAERKYERRSWHRPPHDDRGKRAYHLSAACYQHSPFIGTTPERMAEFEQELLANLEEHCSEVHAWCVLPNHYHSLVDCSDIKALSKAVGRFHGRKSFEWNGEEKCRGRKVWHGSTDRAIRSERHFWATMNYVHNNPVRHGYVERWQEWPFSSAQDYLDEAGKEEAARIWTAYPVLGYGEGWDEPEV